MSVGEIHKAIGLEQVRNRPFQIFKTSAIKGEGLNEAMQYLSDTLTNAK